MVYTTFLIKTEFIYNKFYCKFSKKKKSPLIFRSQLGNIENFWEDCCQKQ